MEPEGPLSLSQLPSSYPCSEPHESTSCVSVRSLLLFMEKGFVPLPKPHAGGRPIVGFSRLVIELNLQLPSISGGLLLPPQGSNTVTVVIIN